LNIEKEEEGPRTTMRGARRGNNQTNVLFNNEE